jgi:4-amino-4-deoxy-L-arabinose transferase-like glycosyltransferase
VRRAVPATFRGRLILIGIFALAVRVAYALTLGRHSNGLGDFHFYNWSADLIAQGHGYVDPFKLIDGHGYAATATHPPLWSYVLSVSSWIFGSSSHIGDFAPAAFVPHRMTSALVGTGAVVAVGLLGRKVGGARTGLVAALLAAVYPEMVATDGSVMSESLYALLLVTALVLAYRVLEQPTWKRGLALGLVIGLATLTRSESGLLLLIVAVPAAWRAPARWRVIGAAVLGAAVLLVPWGVRNYSVFHQVVPVSTNEGAGIGGANCATTYHGQLIGYTDFTCLSKADPKLNEAQQSDHWRSQGITYAKHHAGRLPVVVLARVGRAFDLYQTRWQTRLAEAHPPKVEGVAVAVYILLLPVALLGVLVLRRRGAPLFILLAPAITTVVAATTIHGLPRYSYGFQVVMVVLCASAALHVYDRREALRRVLRAPLGPDGPAELEVSR